jgi:hypothetical protein
MRHAILSAGVLFLIAAADASSQSAPKQFNSCPLGSSCERSYFDGVLASTGAIVVDFFWLTLDGSRRAVARRSLFPNIVTPRANRTVESTAAPSDWRTGLSADDRSIRLHASESRSANSSEDLERTNTLQRSWWDWLERLRASQRSDFADIRKPNNVGAPNDKRANSDAAPRNRGNDDEKGNGDAKPDGGDHHESPKKPDHSDDVLDGALTPEPSTLLLIGSGLPLTLAFVRRRRR